MSDFEYIKKYYEVPACIGRVVCLDGKTGVIVEDRGHYIGVTFDNEKPTVVHNFHPNGVEYTDEVMKPRKLTRAQERYQRYLEVSDCFDDFMHFCYYDAKKKGQWEDR